LAYRLINSLFQVFLHLVIYILRGKAKFLVQHLVRGGETEGVHTPDLTYIAHKALKGNRKACRKAELTLVCRQYALLVGFTLRAEQPFGGYRYDTCPDAFRFQQLSSVHKGRYFRTRSQQD